MLDRTFIKKEIYEVSRIKVVLHKDQVVVFTIVFQP